jgi:hypothetical protein
VANLNLKIDDKLDEQFRNELVKRYGMKRGNIKKAVEEAIELWIEHGRT